MSIINNLTGEVIREESEIEQQDAYLDSMIKKHSLIVQRLKTIKKWNQFCAESLKSM